VRGEEAERAQHLKRLVGARAIRRRVLGAGEGVAEQARLLGENFPDMASVGAKPKSGVKAARTRARSLRAWGKTSPGATTSRPWNVAASGSDEWPLAIEPSMRDTSATVRAIGPSTGRLDQPSPRLSDGTSPGVGRKPTMPQNAAGFRNDPPVSDPVQIGAMPVASATADPPDDPAADLAGSNGLPVAP
jgi:hypothetical protein